MRLAIVGAGAIGGTIGAVRKRRTEVDAQLGTIPSLADNLRELDGVRRRGADEVSS